MGRWSWRYDRSLYDKTRIMGRRYEGTHRFLSGYRRPNGAGKSTLLKAMLGLLTVISGSVKFYIDHHLAMDKKDYKKIAYVPQSGSVDWDFPTTVLDVVLMGRYGHLGWFKRPSKKDKELALSMIEKMGMSDYVNRQIRQLSGGQQQRVFLARALVQEADIYLMDEPFKGVDKTTEHAIISLLQEMKARGKTVIVVHHDLIRYLNISTG